MDLYNDNYISLFNEDTSDINNYLSGDEIILNSDDKLIINKVDYTKINFNLSNVIFCTDGVSAPIITKLNNNYINDETINITKILNL